jgi:RNA polymerase sigma-70 factor (ECF subfamily)
MTDEQEFRRLVEPHRAELHAHCYRMLGSVHDAEDALQETMVRAWRGLEKFEGRSSIRSWLYRIATNVCLDAIERGRRRVLPVDYGEPKDPHDAPGESVIDPIWLEPYPDETLGLADGSHSPEARYELRESVELAFIAALQHLSGRQRAALVLRDVLGFSARETAEALGTTTASVNGAVRRARKAVDERLPERSQQATLRALGDERLRALVDAYVDAWERGDVEAILAMLADDATFAMPPMPGWYRGRESIEHFLREHALTERWRFVPVRANGQVAFATYSWSEADQAWVAKGLDVLTLDGGRVRQVTAFLDAPVGRFGLPGYLGAGTIRR